MTSMNGFQARWNVHNTEISTNGTQLSRTPSLIIRGDCTCLNRPNMVHNGILWGKALDGTCSGKSTVGNLHDGRWKNSKQRDKIWKNILITHSYHLKHQWTQIPNVHLLLYFSNCPHVLLYFIESKKSSIIDTVILLTTKQGEKPQLQFLCEKPHNLRC